MIAEVTLIEPRTPNSERRLLSYGGSSESDAAPYTRLKIATSDWLSDEVDLLQIDREVHRLEDARVPFSLVLEGEQRQAELVADQVLTRYQRLLPLGNEHDSHGVICLLAPHRALFDLHKPLVRADYDHALDVWRWLLRLDPHASTALQLAALFHDVERLSTEADARVEHLAPDYLEFKRRHAAAGATYLMQFLTRLGVADPVVQRVGELVRLHEEPRPDRELIQLNDADSLSFFSLNSWGFINYFGHAHTRTKVHYTLRRMSRSARSLLPRLRQHPRVVEYIAEYREDWS